MNRYLTTKPKYQSSDWFKPTLFAVSISERL